MGAEKLPNGQQTTHVEDRGTVSGPGFNSPRLHKRNNATAKTVALFVANPNVSNAFSIEQWALFTACTQVCTICDIAHTTDGNNQSKKL